MTCLKGDHGWIRNSLIDVGAEVGTFGGNHPSAEIDALSEKLNKSSTAVAAIAALIFTTALNTFFNVESLYRKGANNTAVEIDRAEQVKLNCTLALACISRHYSHSIVRGYTGGISVTAAPGERSFCTDIPIFGQWYFSFMCSGLLPDTSICPNVEDRSSCTCTRC